MTSSEANSIKTLQRVSCKTNLIFHLKQFFRKLWFVIKIIIDFVTSFPRFYWAFKRNSFDILPYLPSINVEIVQTRSDIKIRYPELSNGN